MIILLYKNNIVLTDIWMVFRFFFFHSFLFYFFYIFSCTSAKDEHSLSSLSCVCVYVDQNKGPPQKWHIHWEFLDFKSGFGFTTKFILDWYLFLNGCLQITLIQIYFWYYKTIWGHFNNGCLFLLQTTQPIRMQGQQKSCHSTWKIMFRRAEQNPLI